tara:strand:- start:5234 stop:5845 length:612 start_codon:yes stop_codon:yes gene_type:complete
MKKEILIVNTLGNITSVYNAFNLFNGKVEILDKPPKNKSYSHLILPGVGSFENGMKMIANWREFIEKHVKSGGYLLGICLGMQLLASHGHENGFFTGLDLIKGDVIKLEPGMSNLKIPHVGWNEVNFIKKNEFTRNINSFETFYFIHSYYFNLQDSNNLLAISKHGIDFPSIINFENIFGTQFHPEKSQKSGLKLVENFINLK